MNSQGGAHSRSPQLYIYIPIVTARPLSPQEGASLTLAPIRRASFGRTELSERRNAARRRHAFESALPCLCDPYCPEWRCCSPDPGDRGMERSKRKSPAKRRFPVPVSPGKMGTICKGDFRLDRSIPRSPGSPRPRQDALEHIHAPRSVARSVCSAKRKAAAVCLRNTVY